MGTYLCGDRGWKYRETCSAYKTGCIFVLLRYHDIPANRTYIVDWTEYPWIEWLVQKHYQHKDVPSEQNCCAYCKLQFFLPFLDCYALIKSVFCFFPFCISDNINFSSAEWVYQLQCTHKTDTNSLRELNHNGVCGALGSYLPEYKVFSDDGLNCVITPNIPV